MVEVLNGRYELGEVVGSGGMGAVHRAVDTRLDRTVAVKVLRGGPLADDLARSRMRSEALLAASIHHPGVAQVFDLDEDTSRTGLTFIVMQFVEGHTLSQLLRDQGPMPVDQVMSVVVQVAEGLQAAHDAGVVHRDLKPANIMLTPVGRTVLVDFGIARSAASEPLTSTGTLIGTADYMSPEQAAGRPATARSDLYSLGVVAYHCLTGTSPFKRDSHIATALAHLHDDLPPFDDAVPADVAELIVSLTSKDPSARPTSAAAVALQAATIGATGAIDLPTTFAMPVPQGVSVATRSITPSTTSDAMTTSDVPTVRRRRPKAVYAGLGAAVLAAALLGAHELRPGETPVVPRLVGLDVDTATSRLDQAGMDVAPAQVDVANVPAGMVVKQSPAPGRTRPDDGAVRVSVASGKVAVSARDLVGTTYATASARLEKLGLEVARETVTQAGDVGRVVAVDRSGRLTDGSTVTLSVAVAPVASPTRAATSTGSSASGSSKGGTGTATHGKSKGKSKGKGKK